MSPNRFEILDAFQSTLPMKGATPDDQPMPDYDHVSIHAPNEGSDTIACYTSSALVVSIHAPNEGSDPKRPRNQQRRNAFQSTLPMKGATAARRQESADQGCFNPRSQ